MTLPRVVLAGGSGFLGHSLARRLVAAGTPVTVLTRSPQSAPAVPGVQQLGWDGASCGDWWQALQGAAAVVNFTGKSVNCRHTPQNRHEIVQSRVNSVNALCAAMARCTQPPPVWVQAASLAIYGDAGDRVCDESAPHADGFSAEVCKAWEKAFDSCVAPQTRKVLLRIGFVLGPDGGALETLAGLAKWFLGGAAGNGRQYISWLHIDDFDRMVEAAIARDDLLGAYNATGPYPVTNAQFMRELRRALGRPYSPPVPAPLVRLGAALMGTESELALTGRRCVPRRLEQAGFSFEYPDLAPVLKNILGP